jgi:predicted O-methyltransferase YrrM
MNPGVDPRIEDHIRRLYADADPVRLEMEALARERRFPIVGPLVGRQLLQLTLAIGARRVFELGSGYGYSALFFARGVGEGGEVHCTDLSEENVRLAEAFLRRAGIWTRVTYHREEATAALRRAGGAWDIVYNDIDKVGYPETVDLAIATPRGTVHRDNVL